MEIGLINPWYVVDFLPDIFLAQSSLGKSILHYNVEEASASGVSVSL